MDSHEQLLKEYTEKMANVPSGDTEEDHMNADDLLCELLEKLGYSEVIERYRLIRKWYA